MLVIAHRFNLNGADELRENTLEALQQCLRRGFSVETDIRRDTQGRFYVSHDPAVVTPENKAERFFALFRQFPACRVALNLKELSYEMDLLTFLAKQGVQKQAFLFDMELLEKIPGRTAAKIHRMNPDLHLAARVSDRQEPVERALSMMSSPIIWLDEFDSLWVSESDIRRLKSEKKIIYAISPEIHGFSSKERLRRWRQFIEWGVNGICTDYPVELQANQKYYI